MFWFAFALLGAFCQATYALLVKVFLRRISPWALAGFSFIVASVVLFVFSAGNGIPPIGPGFFPAVAATVSINVIATVLFYQALFRTDLSLCIPMLAFTPVFLILTSFLILGELPSPPGAIGIFLVATGAYLLNLEYRNKRPVSLVTPFRTLRHDRGIQMMLLVAFLYSISVNYDKRVVTESDPIFGGATTFLLISIPFLIITLVFCQGRLRGFNEYWSSPSSDSSPTASPSSTAPIPAASPSPFPSPVSAPAPAASPSHGYALRVYLAAGIVLALEAFAINTAYTMTVVPYVITVKRLAIFFSVLYGGLLLGERQLGGRIFGGLVMIAGAVLIGLLG
jgi:drug/metabolite transporter (DMT)-like permease